MSSYLVAKSFAKGAASYRANAQLQQDVGQALLNKLPKTNLGTCLDLGAGPGLFSQTLQSHADVFVTMDIANEMLNQQQGNWAKVQGDSHQLPFLANSFNTVFSSLMIQWCDLPKVLNQVHEITATGGRFYFSTLVDGSLNELKQAWSQVDDDQHIHDYLSLEQLQNSLNSSLWQVTNVQQQTHSYYFDNVMALAKELKSLGANKVLNRKNKGLVTKAKWHNMEQAYAEQFADSTTGLLPASYQVVLVELQKHV